MAFTRRRFLGAMTAMTAGAARAAAQSRAGGAVKPRAGPSLCLYSQVLSKVDHVDLPMVLRGLGFDGCDLSVQPGGHVAPEKAGLYLMPALEALTGAGLDVPMITTALTGLDALAQEVLGLAGLIGVPFFRPGHWKMSGSPEVESRLAQVQREIAGLASLGRATGMAMGIHNFAGEPESAPVSAIDRVIRPLDPRWVGYDFDVGYASQGEAGAMNAALALALPRLKMVSLRDFQWAAAADGAAGGARKTTPCPLGEGVVEWPPFFAALARARFSGPISLQVDYRPKDELAAIRRDLQFVRKQMSAAYGAMGLGSGPTSGKGSGSGAG